MHAVGMPLLALGYQGLRWSAWPHMHAAGMPLPALGYSEISVPCLAWPDMHVSVALADHLLVE